VDAPSFDDARRAAEDALAAGDATLAFAQLRPALSYPVRVDADQLAAGLETLAAVAAGLGHQSLAGDAARAAADVHDPDALYELGYALVDAGLPAMAAVVLARCLEVVPGSEQVLTELVSALERALVYGDAQRLLEAHPHLIETSFLCRYLVAYNAAMAGDLAVTRRHAPALQPTDDGQQFMADRIASILARADRVTAAGVARLDGSDLRGWHYVLTGGVLTHLSPYGFDQPMRGRYAWLQDSPSRVRTGLDRLVAILAAWGEAPPCIYAPPGRDHEIVAHAAAARLGVPVAPWPAVGVPAPGLVVLYDLAGLELRDIERLLERRPGQILFAHASPWTEDGPLAADVTTLLHQSLTAPWAERLVIDPGDHSTGRAAADDRDPELIGAEIAAAEPLTADEIEVDDGPGLDALVRAVGAPALGRRERLWAGSPVQSNRFE
jgi:hypothetical protein